MLQSPPMGDGAVNEPAAVDTASQNAAHAVCPLCLGLLQTVIAPEDSSGSSQSLCSVELITTVSSLNDLSRQAATALAGAAEAPGGGSSNTNAAIVERRCVAMPSLVAVAASIAAEYDMESFALEVSLPASLAVRHQALVWHLRKQQPQQQQQDSSAGVVIAKELAAAVGVKEAVELKYSSQLAAALGKLHNADAEVCITVTMTQPDAGAECGWLAASAGNSKQRRGHWQAARKQAQQQAQQQQQQPDVPAVTEAVVQRLAAMPEAAFLAACPASTAQLAPPTLPAAVQLQACRRTLHIGGRYLKLRRGIPQSPWHIDGERKGEGSVQEAIEAAVLPALQADTYTFIAAGREDIDVRMLGRGRPFILEIQNARRGVPPPDQLLRMEAAVQQLSNDGVAVRELCHVPASQLTVLKEGEQDKQKSYTAVCWLPRPVTEADLELLGQTKSLKVQQQTPIRVLHRRANLRRPKVVYEMQAARLPDQPPGYFVLQLRTQAGTYIKEFVHGDLGRSQPSLGDLLGGCKAQIVSLDVLEVHMEFGQQ
ncbi:putative tRNA pseudouridine synthase Pus10 [Chlorella vulgaris]